MKTCSKCGLEKEETEFEKGRRQCRVCRNAYCKARRKANPEKVRAANRKWRESNPEKARAACRKWQEANLEKARAACLEWREARLEKARAAYLKWKEANLENARAACRKWQREARKNITDVYVRSYLLRTLKNPPQELIELKRLSLQIKRFIKQQQT